MPLSFSLVRAKIPTRSGIEVGFFMEPVDGVVDLFNGTEKGITHN